MGSEAEVRDGDFSNVGLSLCPAIILTLPEAIGVGDGPGIRHAEVTTPSLCISTSRQHAAESGDSKMGEGRGQGFDKHRGLVLSSRRQNFTLIL
jgi:hypothetical protein